MQLPMYIEMVGGHYVFCCGKLQRFGSFQGIEFVSCSECGTEYVWGYEGEGN